jgi:isoleucyl-tRNA synthetase
MEFKDTLLMPNTDFPMRASLGEKEEEMRKTWIESNIYNKRKNKNKENDSFVLHDGPPYANGNIHIGHALNKILKDFVNRYKAMNGFYVDFIPGWDVHGLPIETAVTNTGVNRKELSLAAFRKLCYEFAKDQVEKQKEQFVKLNVMGNWDKPYVTYDKEFEAKQIEVFAIMAKKGLIYKGLKPVYWSPSSESALAEAEIEYQDKKDPSIYVAFPIVKGNSFVEKGDKLVIWTTTPWTLPGNLAIAYGNFKYAKVRFNDQNYIVAAELVETLMKTFELEEYEIIEVLESHQLSDIMYQHVFMDRVSPLVHGYHVNLSAGTGLVHIAPGYGADDFIIGKQYNLGLINGVNDQGYLTEESGIFNGLFFEEANKEITKYLDENKSLLKLKFISHSYPHDWRTKKPVIFRATNQWFCSIDPIREELLKSINDEITWHPSWGKLRLNNMIQERGDWCISRQRAWGVPIPIFYNEDGSEILDYDVMMHVSKLFKEHGSNIWFEKEAQELLPKGYKNEKSPNGIFTKETDIMDVWFDSGTSHTGVLKNRGMKYPADMYLEGSDQYRGWFNSSLICGVSAHNQAPYKSVLSHGFVLDGKGLKMSKSLGNVIDPLKVINEHGTDVLRLWVSSVDYTEDVRVSNELLLQVKESYRKIRNTYRFMLGNLGDFNPSTDKINFENMMPYDQYMTIKLNEIVKEIKEAYETYDFKEVYKLTNHFISFSLSNFYLDFTKDILYIEKNDSYKRRSVQTVIYETLKALIVVLAPILPYTSEEVYGYLKHEKEESVHLENFPTIKEYDHSILSEWESFFEIKDDVYKALEEARNQKIIGKGLEAKVYINASSKHLEFINKHIEYSNQLLIVSKVIITDEKLEKYSVCEVKVEKFEGVRCERCWNYFEETEIKEELCPRCNAVIND